jgi:sec-independent protein translocase protein TatC
MIDYKMMLSYWRYAIVAIFVVSAALTPPDMISMFLLAIPLVLLYAISVGVAWMFRLEPAEKPAATTTKPEQPETV